MRKFIGIVLIILCSASVLPSFTQGVFVRANPEVRTLYVDDDGSADFHSIQDAVNNASSGDMIRVRSGTYKENVLIDKTVSLIGENPNNTIIDGNATLYTLLIAANSAVVKNFTIRNSGEYPYSGLFLNQVSGNIIANNKIEYNGAGIRILYSGGNVFYNNKISSSNYEGIYMYYTSSNVFFNNEILSNSYSGIRLLYSDGNIFYGNQILKNKYNGIYLYRSTNNSFSGNTISNNYCGIGAGYLSINNIIYHNNFNNTIQVSSQSENFWDYNNEGNYWSDYDGRDFNMDGIGDAPYSVNMDKDHYPLMGMFYNFTTRIEGGIYSIIIISNSTIFNFGFQIGAETGNKIIYFDTVGKEGTGGFCRIKIPTELASYPGIVLLGAEEITPIMLNVSSNKENVNLYFAYPDNNYTIRIIFSKTLKNYSEILDAYRKLQLDFYGLNETYFNLLANYSIFLYDYNTLQKRFDEFNNSYHEHLLDYLEQLQNTQNLTYIFVALTAIFMLTTVYLSKNAHTKSSTKIKAAEEKQS
jgi:nitrous oxidase accessory protein